MGFLYGYLESFKDTKHRANMSLTAGFFEQVDALSTSTINGVTEALLGKSSVSNVRLEGQTKEIIGELSTTVDTESVQSIIRKIVTNSTTQSVNILQDITTKIVNSDVNNSLPEVIINRPEVKSESGIGTAEKVVIGAVAIVVILAIVALILRLLGPRLRPKETNQDVYEQKLPIENLSSRIG